MKVPSSSLQGAPIQIQLKRGYTWSVNPASVQQLKNDGYTGHPIRMANAYYRAP